MLAVVSLVAAAIVLPFVLPHLPLGRAQVIGLPGPSPHVRTHEADSRVDVLGPRSHLPALLPARSAVLREGLAVRVGDVTEGTLRRTPGARWQVVVRWDGQQQPLPTRGAVELDAATSWVSMRGVLYTRVASSTPGRFRVYGWRPDGMSASTPPTLVATYLGDVCFNHAFTAFGDCARG